MGAAVIAVGDPTPVLEFAKHALDRIALLVEQRVVGDELLARLAARHSRGDALVGQCLTIPGAVMAPVIDHPVRIRQRRQHGPRAAIVAGLAFGQQQYQWSALAIAQRGRLGVQATLGPLDMPGYSSILSRLAAVRCAKSDRCG